jgi:hypothetical protein
VSVCTAQRKSHGEAQQSAELRP